MVLYKCVREGKALSPPSADIGYIGGKEHQLASDQHAVIMALTF